MIEGKAWDDFDGNTALFRYDDDGVTAEKVEESVLKVRKELFTWPRILRRIGKISYKGFPYSHLNSLMLQWAHRRAFSEYAKTRLSGVSS